MIPEAACGAEREVKIVEGSEALKGCPTTPAASGQEEDRWLNRHPRNPPKLSPPLWPLLVWLQRVPRTPPVPDGLSEGAAALSLLAHSQPSHQPAPALTEHRGSRSRGSAAGGLLAEQLAGALQPEPSEGRRSLVKDTAPVVDRVAKKGQLHARNGSDL